MWKHADELRVDRTVSFKGSNLTVPRQTDGLLNLDETKRGTGGPSSLKHPPARGQLHSLLRLAFLLPELA